MTSQPAPLPGTISPDNSHARDRLLPVTRLLAAVIVPILLAAFIMLYFFPGHSGALFAWPIQPPLTAMLLGATYLGGAYFFTRVVFAQQWHTVRLGFLPVSAFAGMMGIATVLHWERFTHGFISFQLWALLYFTLPFVIPVVWSLNERAVRGARLPAEPLLPAALRWALGIVGGVMAAASLVLLVSPQALIPLWPWPLTPLTARALAAMFVLPGWVGIGVGRDGRWSAARWIFQAQSLAIGLFLLAMALNRQQIAWGQVGAWTFLGGLLLVLALIGWAWRESRRLV